MKIKLDSAIISLIALLCFIVGYSYQPSSDYDLYRYYEQASKANTAEGILNFIIDTHNINFDFIYFLSFYILLKLNLPLEIANGFYFSFFYISTAYLVKIYTKHCDKLISTRWLRFYFISTCSLPLIYSLSITRTIASICYFLTALIFLKLNHKTTAFIFLLTALLTHIGMIFYYIPIYLLILFHREREIKLFGKMTYTSLLLLSLTSRDWLPIFFSTIESIYFFENFTRYANYLNISSAIYNDLAYYDTIPVVSLMIGSFIFLINLKKYNGYMQSSGFILLLLSASFNSSTMLTQRTIMILTPFIGLISYEFIRQNNNRFHKNILKAIILLTITSFMLNIFGYRVILLKSFYY